MGVSGPVSLDEAGFRGPPAGPAGGGQQSFGSSRLMTDDEITSQDLKLLRPVLDALFEDVVSKSSTASTTAANGAGPAPGGYGMSNALPHQQQYHPHQSQNLQQTSSADQLLATFPIALHKYQHATPIMPMVDNPGESFCPDVTKPTEFQHTHQALTNVDGTVVSLKIDKFGLKDAEV